MSAEYNLSSPSGEIMKPGKTSRCNCLGPPENIPMTTKELEGIESSRREILDRVELPFWRVLTYATGTCLRALSVDWMVWVPITIFCAIRFVARTGGEDEIPAFVEMLSNSNIDVLGGFLSFLLVLFVNQTNSRFFEMYRFSKKSAGKIQDVAGLVSTQLPPALAQRVVRYMNAAHVVGYVGLGGPYTKENTFEYFNQKHNLLTDKEVSRVDDHDLGMESGSAAFKDLVTWCQRDIGRARKEGYIDTYEAEVLHDRILEFRAAMDSIYDYCEQPVHFFYIHFLCLLSVLYLPLFAVENALSAGWGEDTVLGLELLYGMIVLLQSIFVVGLRLLGQVMIDPFGEDLEDLSVLTYISGTIKNSNIIMKSRDSPNVDGALEEKLYKQSNEGVLKMT